MSNLFKKQDVSEYEMQRPTVPNAYLTSMLFHLKRKFPNSSEEEITAFIKDTVVSKLIRPKATVMRHPEYGRTVTEDVDLLTYLSSFKDSEIITPAGAIYTTKKSSILRDVLDKYVNLRNVYKHSQLEAAAAGDTVKEQIYWFLQASAKIFNNAIPGAMGTIYSFLFDLAGYNAITTVARQCVKTGYAHAERMIASNIYVTSTNDVITYVNNHLACFNADQVKRTVDKYNLHIPTINEVSTFFLECIGNYKDQETERHSVVSFISTLSDEERTFIYYAYGFLNFIRSNDTLMRGFIKDFFRSDIDVDPAVDPKNIYSIESDLLNMVMAVHFDEIDRIPKLEEAIQSTPNGVRKLLAICDHMQKKLSEISDIIEVFFKVDARLSGIWRHPNIVRKCVLVSDTDSVIFSADKPAEWYCPEDRFGKDSIGMSAFTVFIVSQSLEHVFGQMCANIGMVGKDRARIKMKNEFFYPVFIRTTMAKHYVGEIYVQEGKTLPEPKLDIKGLNFRGSDLPWRTGENFKDAVRWVLSLVTKNSKISAEVLLRKLSDYEVEIFESLKKGEKVYLPTSPVKHKSEYDTPEITNYFYRDMWQEVFAPIFGDFAVPDKGYVIPIINKGKALKSEVWLNRLKALDVGAYERLIAFFEKNPTKSITRILIPPTLSEVPEIFRDLMDVRAVIYFSNRPFALLFKSFNLNFAEPKKKLLASDFLADERLASVQNTLNFETLHDNESETLEDDGAVSS